MRFVLAAWLLAFAGVAGAQDTAERSPLAPPVPSTETAVAGPTAEPPRRLRRAEDDVNDARDRLILQYTLYSAITSDLTEEKCAEMIAAAERRLARVKSELAWTQELVDLGALARVRLTEPREKLDWAEKELELARNRAKLIEELAELARAEQAAPPPDAPAAQGPLAERFEGPRFRPADLAGLEKAFQVRFLKVLPVSARGDTELHRSMGFDHRDRLDVAVHPDGPEGVWLRSYLRAIGIPYFAFRGFVAGKATGAHIHVGPPSGRWTKGS